MASSFVHNNRKKSTSYGKARITDILPGTLQIVTTLWAILNNPADDIDFDDTMTTIFDSKLPPYPPLHQSQ